MTFLKIQHQSRILHIYLPCLWSNFLKRCLSVLFLLRTLVFQTTCHFEFISSLHCDYHVIKHFQQDIMSFLVYQEACFIDLSNVAIVNLIMWFEWCCLIPLLQIWHILSLKKIVLKMDNSKDLFCAVLILNLGLMHAKQALYHWAPPQPKTNILFNDFSMLWWLAWISYCNFDP